MQFPSMLYKSTGRKYQEYELEIEKKKSIQCKYLSQTQNCISQLEMSILIFDTVLCWSNLQSVLMNCLHAPSICIRSLILDMHSPVDFHILVRKIHAYWMRWWWISKSHENWYLWLNRKYKYVTLSYLGTQFAFQFYTHKINTGNILKIYALSELYSQQNQSQLNYFILRQKKIN